MPQGVEMIAKKYLVENYDCSEYLSEYENGYLQLVIPVSEASIDAKHHHLVFSHTDTNGIEFCFRIHKPGIWAFYPIEASYIKVAASIDQLIDGWHNGTIKV